VPFLALVASGGAVILLLLLGTALALGSSSIPDISMNTTFSRDGKVLSGSEVLSQIALVALLAVAVALALWRELPWGRPLLFLCLILIAVTEWWSGSPSSALLVPLAWWYLYFKPNVRAYYRDLKAAHRAAAT